MILAFVLLLLSGWCQALRPVWNIGHMVNNKFQIDEFLGLGANAVETDIKFGSDGTALYTSHGFPCDCGRDCFRWDYVGDYLDYVSYLTSPDSPRYRPEFVMLNLDLKLKSFDTYGKSRALADLARKLSWHLWKNGTSNSMINIVIHLPSTSGIESVNTFYQQLNALGLGKMSKKVGWEVYSDESVDKIRTVWEKLNVSGNNWQGDGITNCLPRSSRRLQEAVSVRESGSNFISKVYYWTVDRRSTMRLTMRLGVDGLMTNYPNRLVEILQEPEFKGTARLATIQDSPFERYDDGIAQRKQKMVQMPEMLFNREDGDEDIKRKF